MSDSESFGGRLQCHGETDASGVRVLGQLISNGHCQSAWYGERTESTNSVALGQWRQSVADRDHPGRWLPRLYVADHQTAGRGRHGRVWQSAGTSLAFSLSIAWAFQNDRRSRLLSIAIGVAVARMLEFDFAPVRARLKWPNDVLIDGGKVGGILLESAVGSSAVGSLAPGSSGDGSSAIGVVIGVGINIAEVPRLEAVANATPPTSIGRATGRTPSRFDVLASVVPSILDTITRLDEDPDSIVADFRRRCALDGQLISFVQSGQPRQGRCQGIDDEGALVVAMDSMTVRLASGEANLVRIQQPVRPQDA